MDQYQYKAVLIPEEIHQVAMEGDFTVLVDFLVKHLNEVGEEGWRPQWHTLQLFSHFLILERKNSAIVSPSKKKS